MSQLNLEQFGSKMIHVAKKMEEEAMMKTMASIVRNVSAAVVELTPVDTGKARSNWGVTQAASGPKRERHPFAPGNRLGRKETANRNIVLGNINKRLNSYKKLPKQVLLYNSAKHIVGLNQRLLSKQSPKFFVQIGIQQGIAASGNYRTYKDATKGYVVKT